MPHPAYRQWAPIWQQLLDVYEGAGGFADTKRPYLYAHPREWLDHSSKVVTEDNPTGKWVSNPSPVKPSPKLITRRKMARYEPVAATLIDQLRSALFRKDATRTFTDADTIPDDHPLRQFWANADGAGRSLGAVVQDAWTAAAVFGHMLFYAERSNAPSQSPVVLRSYTPLDLIDWLTDDLGSLTAVRLLEAVPRESFALPADVTLSQVRDVDATTWSVLVVDKGLRPTADATGDTTNLHQFGVLPVVALYARRRPLTPTIGRSVLGDPALYIDLYNLTSEVRELLRNQTFAILNVPIGPEGDIQREIGLIGETAGTANVLFSSQAAGYVSPEGTNVQVYHEHIDRLIRLIYRLAVVAWDSDSKDAESADSRKLKKEDLHQMLAGYASECEQVETRIAELVYRAAYGDQWQTRWDADGPSIAYPDNFDVAGLLDELEAVTQGLALELGNTATKEMKKRAVPKLLPNLSQPTLQTIEGEIDAMEVKTQAQQEADLLQMRFGAAALPPQVPPQAPGGAP